MMCQRGSELLLQVKRANVRTNSALSAVVSTATIIAFSTGIMKLELHLQHHPMLGISDAQEKEREGGNIHLNVRKWRKTKKRRGLTVGGGGGPAWRIK